MAHRRMQIFESLRVVLANALKEADFVPGKGLNSEALPNLKIYDHPIRRPPPVPGEPVISMYLPEERRSEYAGSFEMDARVFTLVVTATVINARESDDEPKHETTGNKIIGDIGFVIEAALLNPDTPSEHADFISYESFEYNALHEPGDDNVESGQWTFGVHYTAPRGTYDEREIR